MKFKSLLIMGITILSLGTVSGFTVATHADPTPAERNASLAVDNALTQKYGNHVPTSASIKAENDLDREFEDGSSSNSSASKPQANQSSNSQQSHNSQPTTSNKNVDTSSNNNSNNKPKNSKHQSKNNKVSNKKHNHKAKNQKTKSTTKTKSSKNHKHKSNHHFLEIGIVVVVVILAIIGFCAKLFGHKNKH